MAANVNTLTRSILELGICSLHENGVEFQQKLIGNVLCGLPLQNYAIGRQNWCPIKQVCFSGKNDHVLAHCAPPPTPTRAIFSTFVLVPQNLPKRPLHVTLKSSPCTLRCLILALCLKCILYILDGKSSLVFSQALYKVNKILFYF